MSTHESRQGRLVKAGRVRRSEKSVRIGESTAEPSDDPDPDDGPEVRTEKGPDGRIAVIAVTCSCGETIRVKCHYSGDEDHDTAQA